MSIMDTNHEQLEAYKNILGEKLIIFIEFKKGDPSALRPQDDRKRLIDKC